MDQYGCDAARRYHYDAVIVMVANEQIAGAIESYAGDLATERVTAGGDHGCRASPSGNLDQIASVIGVIDVSRTVQSNLEGET